MASVQHKPRLIVFDLDYTLWPFWVDTHVDAPFTLKRDGLIRDARNRKVNCYPDVPQILKSLHQQNYKLAVASRTSYTEEARQLIDLFGWRDHFIDLQIYPGDKQSHFQKLHKITGIPYSNMIFFDDEPRNVSSVAELGVTCILVEDGMTHAVLEEGFNKFSGKHLAAWRAV